MLDDIYSGKIVVAAGQFAREKKYWLKKLSGELEKCSFPYDYTRTNQNEHTMETITFKLDQNLFLRLRQLSNDFNPRLHMILVAGLTVLLSRYTGNKDVMVGTPIYRQEREGEYVNTVLVLRNQLRTDMTFKELLLQVKETITEAVENQSYPIERLLDKLNMPLKGNDDFPLFDTAVLLQNIHDRKYLRHINLNTIFSFSRAEKYLKGIVEYNTTVYKRTTIERIITHLNQLLQNVLFDVNLPLSHIKILTKEEKKQLLVDFNDTRAHYPTNKTIQQLFEKQVEKTPDNTALKCGDRALTYQALNKKAKQLAAFLKKKGVRRETITGILADRSIEMIVGILSILKAGGAYLPINPQYPEARKNYVLKDSGTKWLLTQHHHKEKVRTACEVIDLEDERLYKVGIENPDETAGTSGTFASHRDLAYVIYTSGSTGNPKGVPITHANICPLLHWGYHLGLSSSDHTIQNLSYIFDWSVWEIFITLTSGAGLYITGDDVLLNPEASIDFVKKNDITVLHITPTQFQYFLNSKGKPNTLKYLFIGAEKLSYDLVQRSYEAINDSCRLFNMYGPTEATIISSVLELKRSNNEQYKKLSSIPLGKPAANAMLLVLDKYMSLCPLNVSGELYIAGDGLARGYLNDPEKTSQSFIKNIFQSEGVRGENVYNTGDLVRWLADRDIEFLGRIDYQVKIRGFRIELGEIENQLLKQQAVKDTIVCIREIKDEKKICAYIVPHSSISRGTLHTSELREYLSRTLLEYMIPSFFVLLEKFPLTPNGKIDREALPDPELEADEGRVAPRSRVEKKLVEIWAEVLALEKDRIGIIDDFFQLGGHSLKAILMTGRIHKELDVKIPLEELYRTATIRGLSRYIKDAHKNKYASIDSVEKKEYYKLSSAQKRLYIQQQMQPERKDFNMPAFFQLKKKLDRKKIAETFGKIVARHETLRTSFCLINGKEVQKIYDLVDFNVGSYKCSEEEAKERMKELIKPFDLSQAPLLRMELIQTEEEKCFIFLDMHHIISDGSSMEVLINDFVHLYKGKNLLPLPVQYKDYAAWQDKWLNEETFKEQERYWLKKLEGFVFTQLPIDTINSYKSVKGKRESLRIEPAVYDKIERFCSQYKISKFIFLITVFEIQLAREIDQNDITIGIPASIREHPDLKNLIGIFLNMLLIRTIIDDEDTFLIHLSKSKETIIEALNNQHYPYEILDYKIKENNNFKRDELFSIFFNYLPLGMNKERLTDEFEISSLETQEIHPKYDMTLYVYDSHKYMLLNLVYKSNIYDEYRIKNLLKDFFEIIQLVLKNEDIIISELNPLGKYNDYFDAEFEKYYDSDAY